MWISKLNYLKYLNSKNFILWLLISIITLIGIYNSFIQDDAFIAFRYAKHLAEGYGLVWNINSDSPVEGYTDFLWVVIVSIFEYLHIEPITATKAIGIIFGIGTLYFTFRLSSLLFSSYKSAILSLIILGINYTFTSYMSGGLETSMQTFFVVIATYMVFNAINNGYDKRYLSIISLIFALSILTRIDDILFCGVLYLYLGFYIIKQNRRDLIYLSFIGIFLLILWLLFKITYYGDILPNTFYVKAQNGGLKAIENGINYMVLFLNEYLLWIPLAIVAIYIKKLISYRHIKITLLMVAIWLLYIIKVGGDFMEFRFLVPILPFLSILIAQAIMSIKYNLLRVLIVAVMVFASYKHAKEFTISKDGIESFSYLNGHLYVPQADWIGIGKRLHQLFPKNSIKIATTAAGAIPYYTDFYTIDMLGLNDKWIAKNGIKISDRSGHSKYTTLQYLFKQKVNFVIGHPQMVPISSPAIRNPQKFFWIKIDKSKLPPYTKILEIPINSRYKLDILYLTPDRYIDKIISTKNLKVYPIKRD